jgi:hypothetical protein
MRECFEILASGPERRGLTGALVASVLVTRDGTTRVGVGGDRALMGAGVNRCVASALETLVFPAGAEPTWFHVPIRFVGEPGD